MTDDTRDQITTASKEYASTHLGSNDTWHDKQISFRDGAMAQHPISFEQGRKEGYNQAVSDAKMAINELFNELCYDVSRMP